MDLAGKVAIVTGGGVRVGKAFTEALAAAGCHILLHYGRSAAPAQQLKQTLEAQHNVTIQLHQANLANADEVATLLPAALQPIRRADILINNAAIFPEGDSFESLSLDMWDDLMNINLRAPLLLARDFAAALPANGHGKIINILDNRTRHPRGDYFTYRLTKGALWQATEMMAWELGPRLTVNGIAIGIALPPPDQSVAEFEPKVADSIPLRKIGRAENVTTAALHLLRDDFLTGVILPVDGGQFL